MACETRRVCTLKMSPLLKKTTSMHFCKSQPRKLIFHVSCSSVFLIIVNSSLTQPPPPLSYLRLAILILSCWPHRYLTYLDSRWRHPYIHGLCTGMVCTWRPLLEKFCILLWQARVGKKIERYKRERGKRKWESRRWGWQELLVWFYTTGGWGRRYKQTDPPHGWTSADIYSIMLYPYFKISGWSQNSHRV
jgi:hypothetical protein